MLTAVRILVPQYGIPRITENLITYSTDPKFWHNTDRAYFFLVPNSLKLI